MSSLKILEEKWIENFRNCPLVNDAARIFKSDYARQLFYGRDEESEYPDDYPLGFESYYGFHSFLDILSVLDQCNKFLHFVGITLSGEKLKEHI